MSAINDEERYCLEMISLIQRQHEAAAKPYVDRLVYLQSIKPHPRVVFDPNTLDPEIFATLKAKA